MSEREDFLRVPEGRPAGTKAPRSPRSVKHAIGGRAKRRSGAAAGTPPTIGRSTHDRILVTARAPIRHESARTARWLAARAPSCPLRHCRWRVGRSDAASDFVELPSARTANSGASVQNGATALTTMVPSIDLAADQRSEGGHVSPRLGRQRPTGREMIFVTRRTGIVGGKKTGSAVAVVQLAQIGRTGQNVVVRVIRIGAEAVAETQNGPGLRHDLHQAHGSLGRQGTHVADAFDLHHGAYPRRRNAEPLRRFGDEGANGSAAVATLRCCVATGSA